MEAKNLTTWELYLSLVIDINAQLHEYKSDELAKRLNVAQEPTKYLKVNGHIIYPLKENIGFRVTSVIPHNQSVFTKHYSLLTLPAVEEGAIIPVSLVYRFKEFPAEDMKDNVTSISWYDCHPGRVIDTSLGELESSIEFAKEEFATKLKPFDITLNSDEIYMRFFLY